MKSQSALSIMAWGAREHARPLNGTSVGCAVFDQYQAIWHGCNIELEFRLGMHAEVSAISKMITTNPELKPTSLLIACPVTMFTPCGQCMDWIMQLGGSECLVVHESAPGVPTVFKTAAELMPFYPSRGLQSRHGYREANNYRLRGVSGHVPGARRLQGRLNP